MMAKWAGLVVNRHVWEDKGMFGEDYSYSYGFNGQEKDNEVGEGITTAQFWEYDSRIARRWNVDQVVKEHESPYACFANNPIWFSDPFGLDTIPSSEVDMKTFDTENDIILLPVHKITSIDDYTELSPIQRYKNSHGITSNTWGGNVINYGEGNGGKTEFRKGLDKAFGGMALIIPAVPAAAILAPSFMNKTVVNGLYNSTLDATLDLAFNGGDVNIIDRANLLFNFMPGNYFGKFEKFASYANAIASPILKSTIDYKNGELYTSFGFGKQKSASQTYNELFVRSFGSFVKFQYTPVTDLYKPLMFPPCKVGFDIVDKTLQRATLKYTQW